MHITNGSRRRIARSATKRKRAHLHKIKERGSQRRRNYARGKGIMLFALRAK